jgi:predicted amidohydrolase
MSERIRVVCQQLDPQVDSGTANQRAATEAIREAAGLGADLIVLPELATSGYAFVAAQESADAALPADAVLFEEWRSIIEPAGAVLVAGFPEPAAGPAGGKPYNSALVMDSGGIQYRYRKTHLWDEEPRWFRAGDDEPVVIDTRFGRLGVLICYDLEFPEMIRTLALRGADVIVAPTNWPVSPRPETERPPEIGNVMAAARLNRVFLACCDRTGTDRHITFTGGSCVIDPDGWVVTERPGRDTGVLVADIDLRRARDKALNKNNDVLADRRPELYGAVTLRGLPVEAAAFDELRGDDVALDLVGALADDHQRRVTEVALDVVLRGVAVAAVDPHRVQRHLHGDLGGEQLGHAGFHVAPLPGFEPLRRVQDQLPRSRHLGGHVRQVVADRLVLPYRHAEGLPVLRIPQRVVERRAGHAQSAGRHLNAPGLQALHHLREPATRNAAEHSAGGRAVVIEDQLARLDALVTQLGQVPGDGQSGTVLDQQHGDPRVPGLGGRIRLAQQGDQR